MTFHLSVEYYGPSAASNIVVQKELPTNQVFRSVVHTGIQTNNLIDWSAINSLAAGSQTNFTITVTPENPGIYAHAASATSSTHDPDPGNNSMTGSLSQISVEVVAADYALFSGTAALNPVSGLFEQHVSVTNTMTVSAPAFRLDVVGLRPGVTLWNATGTTNGLPYVQVDTPLDPDNWVELTLEYYVPDWQPFTNAFNVAWALASDYVAVSGAGARIGDSKMDSTDPDNERFIFEFASIPGESYTILYSDDLTTWYEARPPVVAGSSRTQWYDDGPPKTRTDPPPSGRFYKVIQR